MSHYSCPLNDERERLLDQLEGATDANTRATTRSTPRSGTI
ncbi:hypothetical protein SAMN06269185_1687 [Natronoarchaeum philippinense]|uniref:Uncharacterized protein n=1 Tax=Natronoarchaeum philippinense TaxID=558529 RepID=A0A285NS96_NATPI|nr:hypothetical protein [Natronoarchaeum philippinense]SNZ12392.1 hypothetical protein SAMN06269185_1687 [Natronoarchaeum philippinense]